MQSYIKAKKNQLNIFGLLKIVAFLLILTYLVYRLFYASKTDSFHLPFQSVWPLFLAVLLVPLNWFFEYRKWTLITDLVDDQLSKRDVNSAFYAGMISGLVTPNMIGNFLGRMFYFSRRNRGVVTLLTLIANQSQFIVTLIIGAISFAIIPIGDVRIETGPWQWCLIGGALVFSLVLYFTVEHILCVYGKTKRMGERLKQLFQRTDNFRFKVLLLSFLRYTVFISQFVLVLFAFGAEFEIELLLKIAEVYLVSALIPTLFLGKLGVRESVGIFILGSMGITEVTVLVSSLFIWLVNLIIPTLIATLFVKKGLQ